MIVTRDATMVSFALARSQAGTLSAALGFELSRVPPQGVNVSVLDIDAAWVLSLMTTLGAELLGVGTLLARVRLDDGVLVEVGHRSKDVWLDVRRASAPNRDAVGDALAYVNRHRARRGRRDLDPVTAGWTDDDVLAEALRVGWAG